MLLQTRRWAPDGPAASCTRIDVATAPLYRHGEEYRLFDYSLEAAATTSRSVVADPQGRLHIRSDCGGHEFGVVGPGLGAPPLVLLPVTAKDFLRLSPGLPLSIPIRIWNSGAGSRKNLHIVLTSDYPTAEILHGRSDVKELGGGKVVDLSRDFLVRFTSGSGDFARVRLSLNVTASGAPAMQRDIDVLVAPANLSPPEKVVVLDGRTNAFPTFWQGVHGGGASVPRTVSEGKGDGNGVLQPGEQATVWIQLRQGLDPFDKGNWCRTKIYTDSPWISETGDLQEDKRREWTSAQNRTSVIELNSATPPGTGINAILDCEAYSFTFTPDVRYGKLPLYQPFQFHKHYLFSWNWKVGQASYPASKR